MRRRDFIRLVGGTAALPFAARAQRPQTIDEALREAVERKEIPGVVAMAADRNGVIYQGAFGMADIAEARPLKLDALFRLASMTKPVTAVAAMQLVEQRRIGLDDPVERYFPEFAKQSVLESFDAATGAYKLRPATKPVTVRHLFTHTSGLGYRFTSPTLRDYKPRAGDTARPLMFEPGEQWLYGTSTDWLGRLVEKISGLPLDAYFHRRIFAPLKMSETFYDVPQAKEGRLVAIHRRRADGALVKQPVQPRAKSPVHTGGGGLSSTAADYVRFMRMLLNDGELDGARILSAGSVGLMAQNQIGAVTRAGAAVRVAHRQRRLLLHRRWPRQMGSGLPDHERCRARQAFGRQPELGRRLQHLFLGRPSARHCRRDPDAVPALRGPQGARAP